MSRHAHDIDAAAAAWDARLRCAKTALRDHTAFQAWLQQDIRHQSAYERLQAALRVLRANADLPELSALRDEARNSVHDGRRRRIVSMLSVGASVAAVFLLIFAVPRAGQVARVTGLPRVERVYATSPDERSPITLGDGSVVTLDSGTRMTVRLGLEARQITLLSGRALFKVAKDRRRPFVVKAGGRTITALGTVFDVRVSPRELRVTLAEGSVSVRSLGAAPGSRQQIMKPRQQLVAVAGRAAPVLRMVDIDNALAWADRQFFFEDEPLASAIDEMNRYAEVKIIVDPAVADLRINGMFRARNQAGFIAALKVTLPIDVHSDVQGRLIVSPRVEGKALDV